jgi:hypothetical protein
MLLSRVLLPYWGFGRFALDALLIGVGAWVFGSVIVGLYLLVSLNVFGRHSEEAFSSLRIEDYKHFLRLHVAQDGTLTIYPIAHRPGAAALEEALALPETPLDASSSRPSGSPDRDPIEPSAESSRRWRSPGYVTAASAPEPQPAVLSPAASGARADRTRGCAWRWCRRRRVRHATSIARPPRCPSFIGRILITTSSLNPNQNVVSVASMRPASWHRHRPRPTRDRWQPSGHGRRPCRAAAAASRGGCPGTPPVAAARSPRPRTRPCSVPPPGPAATRRRAAGPPCRS